MIRASRTQKKENPSTPTYSTLKTRSINMGYPHGASHTAATHKRTQKANIAVNPCSAIYTCDTKIKRQGRRERGSEKKRRKERERDWQTHCLLYWTGVPLPWQPAALDWYLEQRVELLQRIWCSVHIWGQLIWRYNQLLLCFAPHRSRNPLFGTQRLAPAATGVKISRRVPD